MKYMIASDIHGSSYYCQKLMDAYKYEKPDRLILLGDILYHGPRNDLPKDYAPKKVIEMLNSISDSILCVHGNCDCEVDQMVLDFPCLADYSVLDINGLFIYCTHGHLEPVKLKPGSLLLCGHTHVPTLEDRDGIIYMNPGSISIPKENSPHSYMILEDCVFTWKDLETLSQYRYKEFPKSK